MTDAPPSAAGGKSWRRRNPALHQLLSHPAFLAGLAGIGVVVAVTIAGLVLSPYDPNTISARNRFQSPSATNFFGTDNLGRDIFTRMAHGATISFQVGMAVVFFNAIAGTALGALSGYYRLLDGAIMRVMDALMAFPPLLLALGIAAALGPSLTNVILALAITYLPLTARIVRSGVLVLRKLEYVDAARTFGARDRWIILRHVVPNVLSPLMVQLTAVFAYAVLAESTLSYLGVGLPPPTPSWGAIIADGRDYIVDAWWICLFPGLAITITVLGLNMLGDGLRDVLDPRLKVSS